MKDKFEELACEFKNESECKEELEDEGLSFDEVEHEHFDGKEEDN